MYKFVRSAKVKASFPAALEWAKEVTEYINNKHSPPKVSVYTGMFGDVNTIFWEAEHKDLASLEAVFAKLTSDPGYWALVDKATGLFIEGSVHDSIRGIA